MSRSPKRRRRLRLVVKIIYSGQAAKRSVTSDTAGTRQRDQPDVRILKQRDELGELRGAPTSDVRAGGMPEIAPASA
jgi:hypothetical protein